jgi:hypothetical protein
MRMYFDTCTLNTLWSSRVGRIVHFHSHNTNPQDKDPWRKNIELRLLARIDGEAGLASSNGVADVSEQVFQQNTF